MTSYGEESLKRMRRHSQSLLQDLLYSGSQVRDRDTPVPQMPGRFGGANKSVAASVINGKTKLLLLENPDTVEIYKGLAGMGHVYLPALTVKSKASSLGSVRGSLTCLSSHRHGNRRGSFASVGSQRTSNYNNQQQSHLKALKELKRSNVTVTMTYLGSPGHRRSARAQKDELKLLQQVSGGENMSVFQGMVKPGEQFQWVSSRHHGFPFSCTLYINGLRAARISACCEYRYAPGFQQGRMSCFRLTWLAGGMPCYRCTSLRKKYSSCQQLNDDTQENLSLPPDQNLGNEMAESCASSPLFLLAKPKKTLRRRTSKHLKKGNTGSRSTDSGEDSSFGTNVKENHKENHKENRKQTKPKQRKSQSRSKKHDNDRASQNVSIEARANHEEDSMALAVEREDREGSRVKVLERRRLEKKLSSCPKLFGSDVELSEESDSTLRPKPELREEDTPGLETGHVPTTEQELHVQLDAMMQVLETSDEVEQLVLRNTGLTDDFLLSLADALKRTPSEVTLLNLNLNLLGPDGAHILLDLLGSMPQVKGLHLFGNQLGDSGVLTLLAGLAHFQEKTMKDPTTPLWTEEPQDQNPITHPGDGVFLTTGGTVYPFTLLELDIGGNRLTRDGLRGITFYMRNHSRLQYLGLAQTDAADLEAWSEFFDSLKGNMTLNHIILDENNLGDQGARLFAEMLRDNQSLRQVDLDRNEIGESGGGDIIEALLYRRRQAPLTHLSLEGNGISGALLARIQQEVIFN
ncbi:hypothetical protein DPEC_G00256770 [Dallia pectoralis]|uniref:Uncharacterized protein n=1 Tax=Dallia pectoralis TaxID=75939 RepID=A0ACC2FQR9_DALPE|nr:hypothetical protein DPEC_G00256770 [Dallia pectoralis]